MATLPADVVTCINNCALKMCQRYPSGNAVGTNNAMRSAVEDWPNQTPALWGPPPWDVVKATRFCDEMTSFGVDTTALRTYFGIS